MSSILIVEDDPVLIKMYQKKFERDGFKVETAIDGQEAIDKLASFRPSIILLDIMLPKIDGLEVLKQIKAKPEFKNVPVILSTNLGGGEADKEKGLKLGAVDYLVKSDFTPSQIVLRVKRYIK